jgi:hypothetical protein
VAQHGAAVLSALSTAGGRNDNYLSAQRRNELIPVSPERTAGLSKHIDVMLVSGLEFGSGAMAVRYEPKG